MLPFHFITPVWGEKFTDLFLKVTLPCQLAQGNLGSFADGGHHKYKICTTNRDALVIRRAPIYSRLCQTVETEIYHVDEVINDLDSGRINKYDVMTICHGRGVREAASDQAAVVFLAADLVFSDGSFTTIRRIAESGKRMVVVGGYRLITETFVPLLLDQCYSSGDGTISISPRDLVRLSLSHIHVDSKILFWDSPTFLNVWPAYLYWDVKGEGILQRGIHLSPVMINSSRRDASLSASDGLGIDGMDYMMRAVPDFRDVHVVEDSDELVLFSLQSLSSHDEPQKASSLQVALWMRRYTSPYHADFLRRKLRFHHRDLAPQWAPVEEASDRVVDSIYTCLEFLDKVPGIQEELEVQKADLRKFHTPKLIEEGYRGYNFLLYRGEFYAVAQSLDSVDLLALSSQEFEKMQREAAGFKGETISDVKSQIDKAGAVGTIQMVEQGYQGYNIIQYLKEFYGLAQSLAGMDLLKMDEGTLEDLQREKKCFFGQTPDEVKSRIRQSGCVGIVVSYEANYRGYIIVQYLSQFYAFEQSLRDLNLFTASREELERLQHEKKCFIGRNLEEVKSFVDAYVSPSPPPPLSFDQAVGAMKPVRFVDRETITGDKTLVELMDSIREALVRGDLKTSRECSSEMVNRFRSQPLAWVLHAKVLRMAGYPQEALEAVHHSLEIEEMPEAVWEMGEIARALGRQDYVDEIEGYLKQRYRAGLAK